MRLHIKEQLRKISYPKTTYLKTYVEPIKVKGATKNFKPTPGDNSTKRTPSYFEHVNTLFMDSRISQSQKSSIKDARISKPSPSPPFPKIIYIKEMPFFMHRYIDRIINFKGDSNWDYTLFKFCWVKEKRLVYFSANILSTS